MLIKFLFFFVNNKLWNIDHITQCLHLHYWLLLPEHFLKCNKVAKCIFLKNSFFWHTFYRFFYVQPHYQLLPLFLLIPSSSLLPQHDQLKKNTDLLFSCSTKPTNLLTNIFQSCPTKKKNDPTLRFTLEKKYCTHKKKERNRKKSKGSSPPQWGLQVQWKRLSLSLGSLEWNS